MTSPAKFKKDKEIITEYDTQVKGKDLFPISLAYFWVCWSLTCKMQALVLHIWVWKGKAFADCQEFAIRSNRATLERD